MTLQNIEPSTPLHADLALGQRKPLTRGAWPPHARLANRLLARREGVLAGISGGAAVHAAREVARQEGRTLHVVACVIGTADDPQGLAAQGAQLEDAGAWVLPSNAQAARAAAGIAGANL